MAVLYVRHDSKVLGTGMECNLILPNEIGTLPLKVLWLCHGGSGNHNEWMYHVDLCQTAEKYHIAIVTVNAQDSCFVDMPYGLKFGTYLGKELPHMMWSNFKMLSDRREDNYISGLSNGGYGCFYLGLTYPEHFSAIGAFSAGDKADSAPKPFKEGDLDPRIRMFGQENIHNTEYSIKHLARELAKGSKKLPKIYHACGGKDPWLDKNLMVKECFEEINHPEYQYEYHQIEEYGHEWKFWEIELHNFLNRMILSEKEK